MQPAARCSPRRMCDSRQSPLAGASASASRSTARFGAGARLSNHRLRLMHGPSLLRVGQYGDTQWYYIPDERFQSIAAGAFHIMAITE
jgi:hypothetical protein